MDLNQCEPLYRSHRFKKLIVVLAAAAAATLANGQTKPGGASSTEWPTYGHDSGGMRYSPLTQITPANVATLKPAWVYHMKPKDAPDQGTGGGRGARNPRGFADSEVTPLVAGGLMYISTPYGRVVALDPTTGSEVWVYKLPTGQPASRGVEYFAGDAQSRPQIVVGTSDGKLFTLDAKSGTLNPAFGVNGVVDLNTAEITHNLPRANARVSTPPSMYRNLIIIGSSLAEISGPGPAGDVRAFDIHTGKLAWTLHSIPRRGEPNFGTWEGDSADFRTGVNVWGFITVDSARGIAYLPFGAPSGDEVGVDRPGNNLYSSSLVAVDARTGKYLWHFQVVHHDIFDYDLEAPPLLLDVKKGGKTIPAVAVINKTSLLFLLDRVTGKPIYDVEERPVPASQMPLEKTSPTQPFPVTPPPLARIRMTMDDIVTVTPELEAACRKLVLDNHIELGGQGPFFPPSYNHVRVNFPSNIGGPNWGGASFNPRLGYFFVNVNDLGQMQGDGDPASGPVGPEIVGTNRPGGRTGPYVSMQPTGRFKDTASNLPCSQPPWGEMVAVNVNTGKIAWKVPLGITDTLPADKQNTGRVGLGGSIATASDLIFIGATDDNRFRALDGKTGNELWSVKLDAAAAAVPGTYLGKDGKQYVVICSAGDIVAAEPSTSDAITAFALPAK